MTAPPPLMGYRRRDEQLHGDRWFPGELVSFRDDLRVPRFHDEYEPSGSVRALVSPGYGLVRFVDADWVDRRARLEIRTLDDGPSARLEGLLADALRIGFGQMDLHRVEGWVTPLHYDVSHILTDQGFILEAVVPQAVRVEGRAAERQHWGRLRSS